MKPRHGTTTKRRKRPQRKGHEGQAEGISRDDGILAAPLVGEDSEREGYISDFISGTLVRDTPEEREAVQVFAMALVNDYGYPRDHIQTRPQHRVKARPSDS